MKEHVKRLNKIRWNEIEKKLASIKENLSKFKQGEELNTDITRDCNYVMDEILSNKIVPPDDKYEEILDLFMQADKEQVKSFQNKSLDLESATKLTPKLANYRKIKDKFEGKISNSARSRLIVQQIEISTDIMLNLVDKLQKEGAQGWFETFKDIAEKIYQFQQSENFAASDKEKLSACYSSILKKFLDIPVKSNKEFPIIISKLLELVHLINLDPERVAKTVDDRWRDYCKITYEIAVRRIEIYERDRKFDAEDFYTLWQEDEKYREIQRHYSSLSDKANLLVKYAKEYSDRLTQYKKRLLQKY